MKIYPTASIFFNDTKKDIYYKYIEYATDKNDIRFNMMLPADLSNYINSKANIKHTSKAGYIRDLIIKDKNYNS